jgi:hypothetical protein
MRVHKALAVLVVLLLWGGGCNDVECGAGTVEQDGRCVISVGDGSVSDAEVDAGDQTPPTCGEGTKLMDGKCVGTPKKPIGAGCTTSSECQSGTCVPAMENLPGGMCTVLACSMDNPCPNGSVCYKLNNSTSLCMPYCDRGASCREAENYHCQPLYSSSVNICAPSCELSKSCSAGTRCNPESGLCELAECTVGASETGCSDEETCYKDSKGLSSQGGLCLNLCETAHPEKNCKVDKDEVCQPLPDDPSKGFCAPPVCTKNGDCPAGAECQKSVCLPPPACGDNNSCPDEKTCVSGKCMPKCPTGDTHCSDIHPGLVCADVLATPACLPLGSFPGSDCRPTADNRCDSVKAGSASVPMVCEQDKCLADCTTGGDTVCSALSSTLQCAHGIFSTDLCLPKGSYPGSACGANNTCAQDLNGDSAVDMSCVSGTCVVGCSEQGKWSGYGDALCSLVDQSLTCASKAGSICVRACGNNASCDSGYSCFDSGAVPAHENACLPTGSFPGSPCRPNSGNQCDSNVGGNDAVDMVCANNTCVVSCAGSNEGDNDTLCGAVDGSLTCSESAGHVCVIECGNGGACPDGYSCLNPGTENACLPTGSFPGSPCRASNDNKCDQNVGGNAAVDMVCSNNTCVVSCNLGDEPTNDTLCGGVNAALTCSESAAHLCVLKCGNNGACPSGYSCLDPGGENACLPNGTFPGSTCRSSGTACDQDLGGVSAADMTCVNNICIVPCPSDDDALCGGVSGGKLTCAESANNICVLKCGNGGACPTGYSCLDQDDADACLPNGTFPGSTCRTEVGNECDQDLGGQTAIDMVCSNNTCAVDCDIADEVTNDGVCDGVSDTLTCSESAGHLCVLKCGNGGTCPTGYSCLSPGAENACLPDGTFPGSACRATQGDECDMDFFGSADLQCLGGTCLVACPGDNDTPCDGVNSALTCYSMFNVCLLECGPSDSCPQGYMCDTGEDACVPIL